MTRIPPPRQTLLDKLWRAHLIREIGDSHALIHIDRHLLHDLSSPQAFQALRDAGRGVRNPELALAVQDHIVETAPGRGDRASVGGREMIAALRDNARTTGIRLFDVGDPEQGIVHVTAAEQGIVLPGMTVACGDSHTATLGALGAWAFGVGTSEVEHILATQALVMRKPSCTRLAIGGTLGAGVTAKDLALGIIAKFGVSVGGGGVIEYCGTTVAALAMEQRFTLCNMAVEAGARSAIIAPDETTIRYVLDRIAPRPDLAAAVDHWRSLDSDEGAAFEQDLSYDCGRLAPQISWGTNPSQSVAVDEPIPALATLGSARERQSAERALAYMGLRPGQRLDGLPIQNVFIGSCTNSRLSDLEAAASVLRGRRVAPTVRALAVPGSNEVKRRAEQLGLDRVFMDAGFEWREPGCSMCVAMNSDRVAAGERCVSTSNRNFEGRQGAGARTHLASPIMAAAAALEGRIADVRPWLPA